MLSILREKDHAVFAAGNQISAQAATPQAQRADLIRRFKEGLRDSAQGIDISRLPGTHRIVVHKQAGGHDIYWYGADLDDLMADAAEMARNGFDACRLKAYAAISGMLLSTVMKGL